MDFKNNSKKMKVTNHIKISDKATVINNQIKNNQIKNNQIKNNQIKNNQNKNNQIENNHIENNQIKLEKEKTRQLELIRDIKKLELKLKNNKKYKHTKKYVDLSSILENSDNDNDNDNNYEENINDHYDTISIQSTKSIITIDYIDLL